MELGNMHEGKIEYKKPIEDIEQETMELMHIRELTNRMGNDSGETSRINEIIAKFENGDIQIKDAIKQAKEIMFSKQDWSPNGH